MKYSDIKFCTKCKEYKKKEDYSKHLKRFDGLQANCKSCRKEMRKKIYYNKQVELVSFLTCKGCNKEKSSKCFYKHGDTRTGLRTKCIQCIQKYNKSEVAKVSSRKYLQTAKGKINNNTNSSIHHKRVKKQTPKWLTKEEKEQIRSLYKKCKILNMCSNEVYHVDHIIPIQGKNISGLHVMSNLRIISRSENSKKSNKYEVQ